MPRAIGANCRLLTIPEATYGTAPAGDWLRMPFLSCDLGAEQPLLDADVIGVGSSRDPAAPFLDTVTVQGQAVVPVDLVNIGHWLRLLLSAPTTTGTSPNFIHSFGSGAAALPSNSIEIGYPDVPNYDLCTGVRADTLEIDFSPTGPATATFGLMGQGSARGASSSGGTPTSAAYTAFHKAQGTISRNGSALAQVTGARLTYANGMEMVRTMGTIGAVSDIEETAELRAVRITLTLSPVPQEVVDIALAEQSFRLRPARLWGALLDAEGAFVADPFPLWAGLMDTMQVVDGAEPRISLTCESRLVDLERAEVRRYTDADQQAEYPGDRFFEFVPALQEAEIRLPAS